MTMMKRKMIAALIVMVLTATSSTMLLGDSLGRNFTLFPQEKEIYLEVLDLLRDNKLPETVVKVNGLIGRNFHSPVYRVILATTLFKLEQFEKSAEICQFIFDMYPIDFKRLRKPGNKNMVAPHLYYIQATSLLNTAQYQEAIAIYKQIIRSNNYKKPHSSDLKAYALFPKGRKPFYSAVHFDLGIAFLKSGDIPSATKQLKKLKKYDLVKSLKLKKLITEKTKSA